MRAWDLLEAFLTTFEDLLAAALPVTFGFVTSSYLSNLTAILEQPDGPQASLLQGVCHAPAFQRSRSEAGTDLGIDHYLCSRLLHLVVGGPEDSTSSRPVCIDAAFTYLTCHFH